MLARILALPFFVILMGIAALSMFFPAIHASVTSEHFVARAFFYSALLFLTLTVLIAIATANNKSSNAGRGHLLAMLAAFIALPILLAVSACCASRCTSSTRTCSRPCAVCQARSSSQALLSL